MHPITKNKALVSNICILVISMMIAAFSAFAETGDSTGDNAGTDIKAVAKCFVDNQQEDELIVVRYDDSEVTSDVSLTFFGAALRQRLEKLTLPTNEEERHRIRVELSESYDVNNFIIHSSDLNLLAEYNVYLTLQTPKGAFTIPTQKINEDKLLQKARAEAQNPERTDNVVNAVKAEDSETSEKRDVYFNFNIEKPAEEQLDIFKKQTTASRSIYNEEPLGFTMSVISGSTQYPLNETEFPCEKKIIFKNLFDGAEGISGIQLLYTGKLVFAPAKVLSTKNQGELVIYSGSNGVFSGIVNSTNFLDTEGHWAKDAISQLASRFIVKGFDSYSFEPNRKVSRAEFVTMISSGLGIHTIESETRFDDVSSNEWFSDPVNMAARKNWIAGIGDKKFGPHSFVTREQALSIIYSVLKNLKEEGTLSMDVDSLKNAEGSVLSKFKDQSQISSWSKVAVEKCLQLGLISGKAGELIDPKGEITRAEASKILYNVLNKIGYF